MSMKFRLGKFVVPSTKLSNSVKRKLKFREIENKSSVGSKFLGPKYNMLPFAFKIFAYLAVNLEEEKKYASSVFLSFVKYK